MTQVFASNLSRRFYDGHWLRFCRHLGIDAQQQGAFNGDTMIGLKITLDQLDAVRPKLAQLNRIRHKTENGVSYSIYLFAARRYRFVEFESYCSVTEVPNEDV